jgi:hypothetical protein
MAVLTAQNLDAALGMALLFSRLLSGGEQPPPIDERQMKAAFVYNFAKFVEWPAEAFSASNAPFSICVLGRNLFGPTFAESIDGKAVNGRRVLVTEISDAKLAAHCHIVFVSSSEHKRLRAILADLSATSALTVGDMDGFSEAGGIIDLFLEDGRIRFRINAVAAERQRLRISSKLLSLAAEVTK